MKRASDADISVIIPAYNSGAFIAEALKSALAQTLQPKEIIVVDDGSSDNTPDEVARVESSLIRYVYQPNSGVSQARNHGIALSTGEFLTFLDADDLWRPSMLERHRDMHRLYDNLVFTFSDFERFDDATKEPIGTQFVHYTELSRTKTEPLAKDSWLIKGDPFCALIEFGEFPAFTPAMMFNRRLLGDLRFDSELTVCEDAFFVLRASMLGDVAYTDNVLADIRRHASNATLNFSTIAVDKLKALKKLQSYVIELSRQEAMSSRLCRAYFSVARFHIRTGHHKQAFEHWQLAVHERSSWFRKLRSSAGLLVSLFRH